MAGYDLEKEENITINPDTGLPHGFTPLASRPSEPIPLISGTRPEKGITPTVGTGSTLINRGGELTADTTLSIDEPVTSPTFSRGDDGALRSSYNRGLELSCEQRGKHSGKATHFFSVAGESDLISTPYALCQKHMSEIQKKFAGDDKVMFTPIRPQDVEKHRSKLRAHGITETLAMESRLRTGGLRVRIPADAPIPPATVPMQPVDLLVGRNSNTFGVRGPALTTHLEEVKKRRTAEEGESILTNALEKLRNDANAENHQNWHDENDNNPNVICPTCIENARQDTGATARGTSPSAYSFRPRNPEGLLRANVVEFGVTEDKRPTARAGARMGTARPALGREHAGTNVRDNTWQSVGYGDQQSLTEALPAHLIVSNAEGTGPRPTTPLERFVESRYDQENTEQQALEDQDKTAEMLRQREAFKNMTPIEQRKFILEQRKGRNTLDFDQGRGELEGPK